MSYSSEVLADSPIAYWKLDGATAWPSGDWYYAGARAVSTAIPSAGIDHAFTDAAAHGDGAHPIATRREVPSELSGGNVSLEAWVRIPSGNVNGPIISLGTDANGWGVGVGGTTWDNVGKQLILVTSGVAFHTTGYTFTTGEHHVVIVRGSGNSVTCYVDGSSVASVTLSSPATATSLMAVGGSLSRSLSSTVDIDEVAIFAAALTSTRVTAHYASRTPPSGWGYSAGVAPDEREIAADHPVCWLHFDDPNTRPTSETDSSGNGHTLKHVGAPNTEQEPLIGTADERRGFVYGYAVDYNGSTQYSTVASGGWMDLTSGLTVEARIRPNSGVLSAGGFIASRWGGGASLSWLFGVTSAGKLTAAVYTASTQRTATGTTTLTAGADYTVALRWTSGGNLEVFLNGSSDGSVAAPGSINNPGQAIDVGRAANASGSGLSWNGRIDEVSLYATALTGTRLAAHHAAV